MQNFIDNNPRHIAWSCWTWKLNNSIHYQLTELNKKGETFNIYFYMSGKAGSNIPKVEGKTPGDKKVWFKGVVADFEYKDGFFGTKHPEDTPEIDIESEGHGWYKLIDIVELEPHLEKPHLETENFTRLDKPGNPALKRTDFSSLRNQKSPFIIVEDLDS